MRQPLLLRRLGGIWLSIALIGLIVGSVSPPPVTATTLLDSADYTFVYPNLPDLAVWSVLADGNVVQQPVEGLGLGMADPDNSAMLMYVHATPFLGGDPNDPNFHNTATFRVRAQVPYVSDGSSAWSTNAIGWRMVLDDGSHRLELALSRSPTWARQVRIQNCSFDPVSFPWDNGLANTYEITRLANGDFVITLTNVDISNPNPVVTRTIPAAQLPGSGGVPMFAWGMGREGGAAAYWLEAHAEVSGPATTTLLDSTDYTFVYPNLPDPAVWSVLADGNVVQQPVEGLGLGMADPDNSAMLMYVHPTPFLSGDPNDPNFHNTATFRVRAQVPYVPDGSSAWSGDAIGWRMILDDGSHRLELALARSPAFVRQVRIQNCPTFNPMPFPWDNEVMNTYEISRLANGDFVITLISADPSQPAISQTVSAGELSPSGGTPMFAWGSAPPGGGAYYWLEAHAEVSGPAVTNQPPVVGPITAPLDPVPVNTALSASAPFSDPDPSDTHTALWDWGDGSTSAGAVSEADGAGTASGDHAYSAAGVYPLTLTVTDDHGAEATATFQYVVVYDPSAGFVTGGGWINSPAGAYAPDPSLTGKANFGFVSRYKKGANTPTGQTEFQFKAGDLNFRSTAYDWLVIAGARAQFKGLGAINGAGEYGFLLAVTDGQVNGGGGADKFRMKIWDRVTDQIIYDNQMGADDAADPATALAGGSIVIHK